MFMGDLNFDHLELDELGRITSSLTETLQGVKEGKVVEADLTDLAVNVDALISSVNEKVGRINASIDEHQEYFNQLNQSMARLRNQSVVNVDGKLAEQRDEELAAKREQEELQELLNF